MQCMQVPALEQVSKGGNVGNDECCKGLKAWLQERIAEREAEQPGGSWRKSYYMPTESDRCTRFPVAFMVDTQPILYVTAVVRESCPQ